jgi:hypothetical protein
MKGALPTLPGGLDSPGSRSVFAESGREERQAPEVTERRNDTTSSIVERILGDLTTS